jgi:hypothetical protein
LKGGERERERERGREGEKERERKGEREKERERERAAQWQKRFVYLITGGRVNSTTSSTSLHNIPSHISLGFYITRQR